MYVFGSGRGRRCEGGVRGLDLGFTNHVGTGGVWDVCLCLWCAGVFGGGVVVGVLALGLGGWVVLCMCVL